MRRPCGSTRPIVAWTSSTLCAGFGLPSATAPVSSVSRSGKYHSEPSAPFTPTPENIVANLEIGVIAPVPFHPWTGPADAMPVPRCAWAAIRAAGDVATFSANPNWATLETLTEGTRSAGSSPDACPSDAEFGSRSAVAEPVATKIPAYGAMMPPKLSQGDAEDLLSDCSSDVAVAALTGVASLPPSM